MSNTHQNKIHHKDQALKARFSPTAAFSSTGNPFFGIPVESSTSTTSSTSAPAPKPTSTSTSTSTTHTTTSSTPTTSASSIIQTSSKTSTSTTSSTPTSTPTPTSTSPTTTSSSTSTPAKTTAQTTTQVVQTTPRYSSTFSTSHSAAAASAQTSPATSSPTSSSSSNKGLVVGGIIAGVVVVAVIVAAVIYFLRKSNNNHDDSDPFDAAAFKRQSMMLPEEPRAPRRGPRPPTMIERHMASAPTSFNGRDYNNYLPPPPPQEQGGYAGAYNQYQQPRFSPGDVMPSTSPPPTGRSLYTPNTAQPFFAPYGESPIGSPVSPAPYGSAYDGGQNGRQQPLSRQASNASVMQNSGDAEQHYVDLSRSSVTPFQAEQYEEISRRLGAQPPVGMSAVAEEHEPEIIPATPPKEKGEFLFTESAPPLTPAPPYADYDPHMSASGGGLPVPPSPAYSSDSSRSRVPSTPPTLPEIEIQQRPFSPMSMSYDFPAPVSARPSPFANSFDIPSSKANGGFNGAAGSTGHAANGSLALPQPHLKRPETVYDPEDAYDGI